MAESKAPAPIATAEETAKLAAAQEQEWGTYVAVQPIAFNGVPAYNVGDPVPVSNVQRYGYEADGSVAKVGSAAAQKLIAAIHEGPQAPIAVQPTVSLNVPVK